MRVFNDQQAGARRGSAAAIVLACAGSVTAAAIVTSLATAPKTTDRVVNEAAAHAVARATGISARDQLTMTRDEVRERIGAAIACFAPGTDPGVMAAVNAGIEGILEGDQEKYNLNNRWGFSPIGEPTTLSWSFVPDGLPISSGVGEGTGNSELFANLDGRFQTAGGRQVWIDLFHQSFDRWSELTGLSYEFISIPGFDWDDGASWGSDGSPGSRGDLRIAMKFIDGQSGVLAYNFFPQTFRQGDMVLDRDEIWNQGPLSDYRFMRNIIMHEHGHGMGISHICSSNRGFLMEPFISTSFDGPQHDDVLASHRHYGDFYEPNDNAGVAVDLGVMPNDGSTVRVGDTGAINVANSSNASLYPNNDSDWFRFSIDTPVFLSVELDPVGDLYDDSDQNGFTGQCNSGQATANTDNIADVAFQIVAADGSTVLHEISEVGLEQTEFGVDMFVDGPGDFYLRVYETGNNSAPQMYVALLNATPAECFEDIDCSDGDPCNGVEICVDGLCLPGTIVDCNNNGIDDLCDISSGFSEDCNGNGVPDSCDIALGALILDSGEVGPLGFGQDMALTLDPAPVINTAANVTFSASTDLNDSNEFCYVTVNGNIFGVLGSPGSICPATPDSLFIQIDAQTWNDLAAGNNGVIELGIMPTAAAVDGSECPSSYGRVQVSVASGQAFLDDNQNGVPDVCEPEPCGIADVTTVNTNPGDPDYGVPDGLIDGGDLSYFVEFWLAGDASIADLTTVNTNPGDADFGVPDGIVDGGDLSFYVEQWLANCP